MGLQKTLEVLSLYPIRQIIENIAIESLGIDSLLTLRNKGLIFLKVRQLVN